MFVKGPRSHPRYHRRGADGSRWVPRSSKPVTPRSAWRGGFDSHAFPPRSTDVVEAGHPPTSPSVEAVLKRLRPSVDGLDPDALAAVVRETIDEERSNLAAGMDPRDTAALADAAQPASRISPTPG